MFISVLVGVGSCKLDWTRSSKGCVARFCVGEDKVV